MALRTYTTNDGKRVTYNDWVGQPIKAQGPKSKSSLSSEAEMLIHHLVDIPDGSCHEKLKELMTPKEWATAWTAIRKNWRQGRDAGIGNEFNLSVKQTKGSSPRFVCNFYIPGFMSFTLRATTYRKVWTRALLLIKIAQMGTKQN